MNFRRLIISLGLPQLAGLVGGLFTGPAISSWYVGLVKPSFSPPSWVFGPVWFFLYLFMGVSVYLVWMRAGRKATYLFWVHLFFNATWSIIFFGLKNPGLAFINIIIIWLFIVVLMIKFWKINKWSTYLLAPYFLWASFAAYLNYMLWILN